MEVTALQSIDFPELKWGINAGETRELPDDKEAQKIILAAPEIKPIGQVSTPAAPAPKKGGKINK